MDSYELTGPAMHEDVAFIKETDASRAEIPELTGKFNAERKTEAKI